jgi:8-oxo-dGTP pyrophosphatase MutT (NUDIX family)
MARIEGELIRQACVIPFRIHQGTLKFCLITSLKKKKWIFPKGVVEPGETPAETGLKEAWEEAGLRGQIVGEPVGSYADRKWQAQLDVCVLLMSVTQCEDDWPEMRKRQRAWMSPAMTLENLPPGPLKMLFEQVLRTPLATADPVRN